MCRKHIEPTLNMLGMVQHTRHDSHLPGLTQCSLRRGREGQAAHLALHAASLSMHIYCGAAPRDDTLTRLSTALYMAVKTGSQLCQADTHLGASLRAGMPHLFVSPGSGFGRLVALSAVGTAQCQVVVLEARRSWRWARAAHLPT